MTSRYRQDMQRAWSRIAASPTGTLETHLGTVQYADQGAGPPVLVCHGEVYTLLLDQLGIDRAAIVAYSAGSASALELALRHPDRVLGLVLANARLGGPTPSRLLEPIQGTVYGWERLWWLYRTLLPSIYARLIGVPKGYQPTPEDVEVIQAVSELQFPLKPRKQGAIFDGFVSNMVADRFPLEELTVPTLIVSAMDDPWARHTYAVTAAARIPGAKLVRIDRGGHLFLSHDGEVRTAIGGFIESAAQAQGGRR
jgi:pimeloyl-ACP methyl ester carboxylesterase